jgi:hypothetical protein
MYKPLIEDGGKAAMEFRSQIDLLLLSCARAEASATKKAERDAFAKLRSLWSDNLATFLNG